jgi:hypothetical protein
MRRRKHFSIAKVTNFIGFANANSTAVPLLDASIETAQ